MSLVEDDDNPNTRLRLLLGREGWCLTRTQNIEEIVEELDVAWKVDVLGRNGRDDNSRAWKSVFERFAGRDGLGNPEMGSNRRLQRSCGCEVRAIVTRLVEELQDVLGFSPRLSLHAPNYLGRLDGCPPQAYHRDTEFRGVYFVLISLCDNYVNYVIDQSHIVDEVTPEALHHWSGPQGSERAVTMNKGDIFVGHGYLVHRGGGSPVAVDHDPSTHGLPGLLNRTSGERVMNTLALHVFLDHDASRGSMYGARRVNTVPVAVNFI